MSTLLWIWGAGAAATYVLLVGGAFSEAMRANDADVSLSLFYKWLLVVAVLLPLAPLVPFALIFAALLNLANRAGTKKEEAQNGK